MESNPLAFETGSGNVFADLGLPHPEEHLLKAEIVLRIQRLIEERELSLREAAHCLGIGPSDLEEILRGQFQEYPMERLLRFINALGNDVRIVICSQAVQQGEPSLTVVTV